MIFTTPVNSPFLWGDIGAVYLLSAIPLAFFAGTYAIRTFDAATLLVVGIVLAIIGIPIVMANGIAPTVFVVGLLWRSLSALMLVTGLFCLGMGLVKLLGRLPSREFQLECESTWPAVKTFAVAAVVALLLPAIFTCARCRHDSYRVLDSIDQSRYGEALALANQLIEVQPSLITERGALNGIRLRLSGVVRDLKDQAAHPLHASASDVDRLERAQSLAMLGQTDAALQVIDKVQESSIGVCNLQGTIYETRGEWQRALQSYRRGLMLYDQNHLNHKDETEALQAMVGVAYSERKLGHYHNAETAYQQVLAFAPTAESHFLMAQFYEDTQQTTLARDHVRQAMQLDPAGYSQAGEQLLTKLTTTHFGCLGVFWDKRVAASSGYF